MNPKILLSLFFLFQLSVFSQPAIEWQKSLGGEYGDDSRSIRQTTDGGYIIAGASTSFSGDVSGHHGSAAANDCWIVKLNDSGIIQWQKSLGGSGDDEGYSIQQTIDGGYIVAGYSTSIDGDVTGNHGNSDYWIVKLDNTGIIEWQKSLGGSGADFANSVQQTTDGGYIVAGFSYSNDGNVIGNHGFADYWILKLNGAGIIEWQKSLGGSDYDQGRSIQQTIDGGYIVAGWSESHDGDVTGIHGENDYWIVKLSSGGSIQWQKSLGGTSFESAFSIQQTTDGGYIIAGSSLSTDGDVTGNQGNTDCWIVKLNSTGVLQWQKSLGGSDADFALSIQQTTDGGYIVAGNSRSKDGDVTGNHGINDCWIVKINSGGSLQWQKSLGGSDDDIAFSIQQTTDGGYVVAGWSASTDGDVTGNHSYADCWIVKLSPYVGIGDITLNKELNIFPNPATNHFTISLNKTLKATELTIFNVMGEKVYSEPFTGKEKTVNTKLSAGIYFVRVSGGEEVFTQKVVVE